MEPRRVVKHPKHGAGRLLRTLVGGYLWEVQFDSGRRYRLPSHQFEPESIAANIMPGDGRYIPPRESPDTDEFRNRQTMEALRFGVVPVQNVKDLTIGLQTERANMERGLSRTDEHGGDSMAIIADYGFGKSHFIELTAQTALERNFVVASASLDLVEVPPGKAREIYRTLVASLRYPGGEHSGLKPLIDKALANPAVVSRMSDLKPIEDCPVCVALNVLLDCRQQAAHDDIVNWLAAQIRPTAEMRVCLKKPPALYTLGETARQYAYLLTALSTLASQVGYRGLVVLIDESEHYSLLRPAQKERADSFFKAMILAASSTAQGRIDPDSIPNHTRADYPIRFGDTPHLFFMFASTESDSRMPIESWLAPSQVVRLDDRFLKEDIDKFVRMVLRYHSVAYHYKPLQQRYEKLVMSISAILSRTLNQHRINIRELIRYAVTVCDLLYLHPDYLPLEVENELAQGLGL
jgi:hypothetical protein